jgi:2-polyprenyl-3-methyl-5-hydroxy-6-metoxy-1,4-benzoquinol methylase
VDYSEERIQHAKGHYGQESVIDFQVHDLRDPLDGMGLFDLIWARLVLEYNCVKRFDIIRNLTHCLKPGGHSSLLDQDHNYLNHYELPGHMEDILFEVPAVVEKEHNFDPYAGRKMDAYLYDLGYEDIRRIIWKPLNID